MVKVAQHRTFVILLMLLSMAVFVGKGYKDERAALHFRDFKQPYASARCVLHGCDPYSENDTLREFLSAGGADTDQVVFQAYSALYPPPSLLALAPVAILSYPVAHAVWFALIALLFCVAAAMVAELAGVGAGALATSLVLAVFVATSTILLMDGQVSGPVIALLVIGVGCLLQRRLFWIAVLCLTMALLLKPHDALLIVFGYLLCAGAYWRRACLAVLVLAGLFTVGSVTWFAQAPPTVHWRTELEANLKGNSSPGNVNDPVLANREASAIADLQALVGTVDADPKVYNLAAVGVTGGLLLLWAVPVLRLRDSRTKHLLALAAIACLTLLPIYHRQYDTRLLLLIFPATALLLRMRPVWGLVALSLAAAATLLTWHKYLNGLSLRANAAANLDAGRALLLYRPLPEIELALACFYIAALWMALRAERGGETLA